MTYRHKSRSIYSSSTAIFTAPTSMAYLRKSSIRLVLLPTLPLSDFSRFHQNHDVHTVLALAAYLIEGTLSCIPKLVISGWQ